MERVLNKIIVVSDLLAKKKRERERLTHSEL